MQKLVEKQMNLPPTCSAVPTLAVPDDGNEVPSLPPTYIITRSEKLTGRGQAVELFFTTLNFLKVILVTWCNTYDRYWWYRNTTWKASFSDDMAYPRKIKDTIVLWYGTKSSGLTSSASRIRRQQVFPEIKSYCKWCRSSNARWTTSKFIDLHAGCTLHTSSHCSIFIYFPFSGCCTLRVDISEFFCLNQ